MQPKKDCSLFRDNMYLYLFPKELDCINLKK